MIKLDLITGFLGAGKTTFLKHYVKHLVNSGEKLCVIENDFGAINVDMVLLQELESENCNLEMVIGGDGKEAHKRRLKTKLISMAMLGYTRVIIEPSGIYDVDEFFDLIYEDPISNWYEIGNVIAIVNAKESSHLSQKSRYLLMSEVAQAGLIVFSRTKECTELELETAKRTLETVFDEFGCRENLDKKPQLFKDFESFDETDFIKIVNSGFNRCDHVKMAINNEDEYQTIFYFDFQMEQEKLIRYSKDILDNSECGVIHRIKGIIQENTGEFYEINITRNDIMTKKVNATRAVLIIIGEEINKSKISEYLGTPSI